MSLKSKQPARSRQRKLPALLSVLLLLSACNVGKQTTGVPPGFIGGVVADEPQAALIGRDILAAGGSAADAAVAAAFAMSVTLPSRAGLGGGGMCLAYDPLLNRVEALDFIARAPATPGDAVVPATARGLFALYGRLGRLRWEQLVAPAEGLARFGTRVSRALATDLAEAGQRLAEDAAVRQVFFGPGGAPLGEGDTLVQEDLSVVLTGIRERGGSDLYQGHLADRFVEAARAAGAVIGADDLRNVAAIPRPSVLVRHDDIAVHFAPPPSIAGATEAQLFAMLAPRWQRARTDERPHLLAEAGMRAAADRGRWLAPDLSIEPPVASLVGEERIEALMAGYRADARTTVRAMPAASPKQFDSGTAGVVAVDRDGGGVACSFTMNGLFGLGRMAGKTGVLLAANDAARGPQMLAPVLAAMARGGRIVFAATSDGGWPGTSALVQVMLRTVIEEQPLETALDAARIHVAAGAAQPQVEEADQGPLPGLAARGYDPSVVATLGEVNAIYCPDGLFENAEGCQFRADRRGDGYAAAGR